VSEFIKANEIYRRIIVLYDSYRSQRKVYGWVEIYKEGWMDVTDCAYHRQSSTATCFVV
jgi:hypothetical protein